MRSVLTSMFAFIAFGFGSLPGVSYNGVVVIGIFDEDPMIHTHQDNTGIYLFTLEL